MTSKMAIKDGNFPKFKVLKGQNYAILTESYNF